MKKIVNITLIFLLGISGVFAQINPKELAKWEGRKYSMFIHWGIYAQLGGVWDGKNIARGLSEQIQAHAGIYSDTYANVANGFNPTNWDADAVALLAKKAGMKSIVFTSKHHDGFCMYNTKTTDYNVVDATPYKRDVLKELSDACARHGLKFGLYYSLIDWHFATAMPISSHNSDSIPPAHFEYNKTQIKELLTNYGEISELWFDMGSHTLEQSVEMKNWVREFQPNCMVGSRLGNGQGDFMVMGDNQEPSYIIGVPWQSPASFFDETWGYRSWQDRGSEEAKYKEKLTSLINVCGRGGNFLLNIGPRGDGSVVEFEENILLEIGKWLDKNGEAIYNTKADPFHKAFDWGAVTSKNNNIYLHVLNMPTDRKIVIPVLSGNVSSVSILGEKVKCNHKKVEEGIEITIPKSVNADEVNVVNVYFKEPYTVLPLNIIPLQADTKLNQYNAFNYYSHCGVDYNSIYQSTIREEWTLLPNKSTSVTPILRYTQQEVGKIIKLQLGDELRELKLDDSRPQRIENAISDIRWGDIYMQKPRWSALSSIHGDLNDLSVAKQWGGETWSKTNYKNNQQYTLDGGLLKAYNTMQEIDSPIDQKILVSVTSGDGVVIALNGTVLVRHGNMERTVTREDVVLLDLKKGRNVFFVKLFSNFRKKYSISINYIIPQVYYTQDLPNLNLSSGKYLPVSVSVDNPISIHETMNLTNLNIEFK